MSGERDIKWKEMATPLTGLQKGGGIAVLSNIVNKDDSSSPSSLINGGGGLKCLVQKSLLLIFLLFDKVIQKELDALHQLPMSFATGKRSDIHPLLEWCHFLRLIYKHHSNAEDEVIREIQKLFLDNRDRLATKNFGEGDGDSN